MSQDNPICSLSDMYEHTSRQLLESEDDVHLMIDGNWMTLCEEIYEVISTSLGIKFSVEEPALIDVHEIRVYVKRINDIVAFTGSHDEHIRLLVRTVLYVHDPQVRPLITSYKSIEKDYSIFIELTSQLKIKQICYENGWEES